MLAASLAGIRSVKVLVVGAGGTAQEILAMAALEANWRFTAVDPSEPILAAATQQLMASHLLERTDNRDAFHTVGRFQSERENLYSRIQSACTSALRIPFDDADGLVHIPDKATFHLSQDDPAEMDRYFHRVSYLCKAATKDYGSRCRAFGCSRG